MARRATWAETIVDRRACHDGFGLIIFGYCFHAQIEGLPVLVTMFLAVGAYNLSIAPLAWLIMSEIFPNRIRDKAMAIATFSLGSQHQSMGKPFHVDACDRNRL